MKNPLAEQILFLQVKNRDKEAYARFYDLYAERIYRFIYFKVNSVVDAQDLTSEVFLKLWQTIKNGKEIKKLNAFIYIIARNSVIDFYRHKSRRESKEQAIDGAIPLFIADEKNDLLKKQLIDSDLATVVQGLGNLKDEYREVIILRFMDELSVAEIAKILKKSSGAVRVIIYRALKALKETINPLNS